MTVGRHSSPEQAPYLRSVLGWVVPWVLVAAVAVVAVVVGVGALGQQPIDAKPPPQSDQNPAAAPSPERVSPSPQASPSPSSTKEDKKEDKQEQKNPPLITDGVTVQVLNAAGASGADEAMIRRLRKLGYEIAATVTAARLYDRTTVFWSSPGGKGAARALAARYGWRSGPKPANLSPSVDIHVVVGLDER